MAPQRNKKKLRIGSVPYLNSKPLIEGLENVLLLPPSDLSRALARGRVDVALVSSVEVFHHDWDYVRGVAVASPGKTDSVRLYHRVEVGSKREMGGSARQACLLTRKRGDDTISPINIIVLITA